MSGKSDTVLNAETIEAMDELESGGGYFFEGSTEELFMELMNEKQ